MREATFNALGSMGAVEDAAVLDLFAGSGALGIEALSRGAASVVFVDSDPATRRVVEDNLAVVEPADRDRARVVVADTQAFLRTPPHGRFDLVLADPPYAFDAWEELFALLGPWLGTDAVVVCESDREIRPAPHGSAESLMVFRVKRYGGTVVTINRRVVDAPNPPGAPS